MPVFNQDTKITKIYKGDLQIKKAYSQSALVFSSDPDFLVQNGSFNSKFLNNSGSASIYNVASGNVPWMGPNGWYINHYSNSRTVNLIGKDNSQRIYLGKKVRFTAVLSAYVNENGLWGDARASIEGKFNIQGTGQSPITFYVNNSSNKTFSQIATSNDGYFNLSIWGSTWEGIGNVDYESGGGSVTGTFSARSITFEVL